jgi:hypothetical protein
LLSLLSVLCIVPAALGETPVSIDFNRDIRPILADTCFKCHGPDPQQRTGGLRLDTQEGLLAESDGHRAVVPGNVAASELISRITSADPDVQMPPKSSGRELTARQIELLKQWITQGAPWSGHWAFAPLKEVQPPKTDTSDWCRNPIDQFVLNRLEQEHLQPAAEADRTTLARRAALDLTGLPPAAEDVSRFVADPAPDAWENYIDSLLRSPRYGERMAVSWLDEARYADTSGYQNDGPRQMWRWRDWVIDAFNANMPFDQFTIEQIAGDMLPNPTLNQLIATGFNRNHRGNAEGGIIPEEYQVEYVVDRVDTTSTVWLGLTMGCARCHDHKYDPISQRDYYQTFAYFNNIPEDGRAIKVGNSPPLVKAPLPEEQAQLDDLNRRIAAADIQVQNLRTELDRRQQEWESQSVPVVSDQWTIEDGLVSRFSFDGDLTDAVTGGAAPYVHTTEASEKMPATLFSDDAGHRGLVLDGSTLIQVGDTADFGYLDRFSLAAWIRPTADTGTIVSRMTPEFQGAGYYVQLEKGFLQVNLINRWLDDALRVQSRNPLPLNEWHHITVVYDGSRVADGVRVYVNGTLMPLDVQIDRLNQTFAAKEPLRIGGGQNAFSGSIDEVLIYQRDLSSDEVQALAAAETISEILALAAEKRTVLQQHKLTHYFVKQHAPATIRDAFDQQVSLQRQRRDLLDSISTVMVMQELPVRRATYILIRGQYDHPGELVEPGSPAFLPPLPEGVPNNRLGFARWLVSSANPLTPRVAMNRYWQRCFGAGLVRTTEDFGAQGDTPSHPELLDWLASEFVNSGWNIKAMQKLIVTSATYRQSSRVTADLLKVDPENRLLSRGPRFRLPAEVIRDQALFASGLLSEKVGGPSVRPYQPDGLWKEIATDMDYLQSHGNDLYRRSLYTYWKRTVAPPTMVTLDATSREACTVQRPRTNTPLQALALMNDPTFVEAARVLAQRALKDTYSSDRDRIDAVFRTVTLRSPRTEEQQILEEALRKYRLNFQRDSAAAEQLAKIGEFPRDAELNVAELASYTTLTSLIMNLDEVVNKE